MKISSKIPSYRDVLMGALQGALPTMYDDLFTEQTAKSQLCSSSQSMIGRIAYDKQIVFQKSKAPISKDRGFDQCG